MNYQLAANTIRGLAMDGVEKAKSGHPGMPMGMADVAAVLWLRYLKHDPADPTWADRDRFVLSAGHGSMLIYSLLHLAGYGLPIEELQKFRQLDSKTPGHPEFGETVGVETTTGPLGQGSGNAVGMAIAEQMLAARFNREGLPVVNHRTFVIAGDGCLMEGISHEVFSMAGHLKLGKLVLFYDSNNITIEGSTSLACSDDVRKRFEGYNWHVLEIDGHNHSEIEAAINGALAQQDRPTIIITHTHIAHGAPHMHDSHEAHGAPLGPASARLGCSPGGCPFPARRGGPLLSPGRPGSHPHVAGHRPAPSRALAVPENGLSFPHRRTRRRLSFPFKPPTTPVPPGLWPARLGDLPERLFAR